MLFEEKDRLLEDYGIIRCTEQQLSEFDPKAVIHRKITPYGAEALIKRKEAPNSVKISPVTVEELFLQMSKEAV